MPVSVFKIEPAELLVLVMVFKIEPAEPLVLVTVFKIELAEPLVPGSPLKPRPAAAPVPDNRFNGKGPVAVPFDCELPKLPCVANITDEYGGASASGGVGIAEMTSVPEISESGKSRAACSSITVGPVAPPGPSMRLCAGPDNGPNSMGMPTPEAHAAAGEVTALGRCR